MPSKTYYIGVDPSITNTGVVVLNHTGGTEAVFNSKYRASKMPKQTAFYSLRRYREIVDSIIERIDAEVQDSQCVIAYEDYSYDSQHFAFTLGEFNGFLKLRLVEAFGGFILAAPMQVKKFATGTGRAPKESIQAQANIEGLDAMMLPEKQKTTDISDAYFLAKIAWYIGAPTTAATIDTKHPLLRQRLNLAKTIYGGMDGTDRDAFCNNYACERDDGGGV